MFTQENEKLNKTNIFKTQTESTEQKPFPFFHNELNILCTRDTTDVNLFFSRFIWILYKVRKQQNNQKTTTPSNSMNMKRKKNHRRRHHHHRHHQRTTINNSRKVHFSKEKQHQQPVTNRVHDKILIENNNFFWYGSFNSMTLYLYLNWYYTFWIHFARFGAVVVLSRKQTSLYQKRFSQWKFTAAIFNSNIHIVNCILYKFSKQFLTNVYL